MKANAQGLGKGLAALFGEAPMRQSAGPAQATRPDSGPQMMPLGSLAPNPGQPRTSFDEEALRELADSIRAQGVLQPLLVRPVSRPGQPPYEIVAGERRFRASQLAGLAQVPVIVRDMSDEAAMVAALIENLQREDLNPVEEARGMKELTEKFSLSQDEVARRIGKSRSLVANTLRLLNLPEYIQRDIAEQKMTAGQARPLLVVDDPDVLDELHRRIIDHFANARQVETWVSIWKSSGHLPPLVSVPGKDRKKTKKELSKNELEQRLEALLGLEVRQSGTPDKGKITIAYTSANDLALLTALFENSRDEVARRTGQIP